MSNEYIVQYSGVLAIAHIWLIRLNLNPTGISSLVPLHQVIWRRAPRGPGARPKRVVRFWRGQLNMGGFRGENMDFQLENHQFIVEKTWPQMDFNIFFLPHLNRFRFSMCFSTVKCHDLCGLKRRILLGFHQHNLRFNIQTFLAFAQRTWDVEQQQWS